MADVFRTVEPGTLVVLDLDNNVMEAVGDWGSDQWYDHLVEHFRKIYPEQEAVDRGLKMWADAQHTTEVRPVEPITPGLIRAAQAKGIRVIGLTARPDSISPRTIAQLASIGIDLSKNGGEVIAVGPTASKGQALIEYLERTSYKPKKVVFSDDKPHYVKSISAALAELGIAHDVFRYGGADAHVADYYRRQGEKNPCLQSMGAIGVN
jgi:hypothetical protein